MSLVSQSVPPLISASELKLMLRTKDIVIADTSNGPGARENYNAGHIDGALYVDLNSQLADIKPNAADGGRHPLPTPAQFSKTLTDLGITPESHVVIYDDKNGSNAAARFWWMLKSAGHKKVQVLDGGFQAAVDGGVPVNAMAVSKNPNAKPYVVQSWQLPLADLAEVEKVSEDDNFVVIDVRDYERYAGIKEPIDLIAGHIPGAINIPFSGNLDSRGFYLSPDELRQKYNKIFQSKSSDHIIVHCGSGVTACHTLLAMAHAGLEIPKLYVGSWSEWSRNNKPIATEV